MAEYVPQQLYRIVETDNFGGDYPDEKFVMGPMSKADADYIAKAINERFCCNDHDTRHWVVVPHPYTLQPGFEP